MSKNIALLEKYQNFAIYRWAAVLMVSAPIPIAITKLNGFNLSEWQITLVMILGNLIWLLSERVNALPLKVSFTLGAILDFVFMILLVIAYLAGAELSVILITFPTSTALVNVLMSTSCNKVDNKLKNLYGAEFEMDRFKAKSVRIYSITGLSAQLIVMGVYSTGVVIDPLKVLVWGEVIGSLVLLGAEVVKWKLLTALNVLD